MHPILRKIWFSAWGLIAFSIILVALLFSVIRMLLPYASQYKSEIENLSQELTGYKVEIKQIEAGWDRLTPQLKLVEIALSNPLTHEKVAHVDAVVIGVKPLVSLLSAKLELSHIDIMGANISISRDKEKISVLDKSIALSKGKKDVEVRFPKLLDDKRIRLIDSTVAYADSVLKAEYLFSNVSISLIESGNNHKLFLSSGLPEELGNRIELALNLSGDQENLLDWGGEAYIKGELINVAKVLSYLPVNNKFKNGLSNFELWMDWNNSALQQVSGSIEVIDILLETGREKTWYINSASMQMFASRDKDNVSVVFDGINISQLGRTWESTGLVMHAQLAEDKRINDIQISADVLRIDDLTSVMLNLPYLKEDIKKRIRLAEPHGYVKDFIFGWKYNTDVIYKDITLAAKFDKLGVNGHSGVPSVSGLSGELLMKDSAARIKISSRNATLEFKKLFRDPFELVALHGDIDVHVKDSGLMLSSKLVVLNTPHLKTSTRFGLWIDEGKSPYMDLFTQIHEGKIRHAGIYSPVTLPPKTLMWLDNSIKDGNLINGEFEFKGDFADYPFRDNNGIFRAEADFVNGVLKYVPTWPIITKLNGHILFNGPSMLADVYSAKTFDATISNGTVEIADLRKNLLDIDLYAYSTIADAVEFIKQSPIRESFSAVIDSVNGGGHQGTQLSIEVPLLEADKTDYRGEMELFDAELLIPDWYVNLTKLNTHFIYTNNQISMPKTLAKLNDRDVHIITTTAKKGGINTGTINLFGDLSFQDIFNNNDVPLAKFFKGDSYFDAKLLVPFNNRAQNENVNLLVKSSFEGVDISLPKPMFKKDESIVDFALRSEFLPNKRAIIDFNYDNWLKGKLLLAKEQEAVLLKKAGVALRKKKVLFPEGNGTHISGSLDQINLDEWMSLSDKIGANSQVSNGVFNKVSNIDMFINHCIYSGRHLRSLSLKAERLKHKWSMNIEAEAIKGEIIIPLSKLNTTGLTINLEYLDLNTLNRGYTYQETDPSEIPPIKFASKKLLLNEWNLSNVSLLAAPVRRGLKIHSLVVDDPVLDIKADGEWLSYTGGKQLTKMHASINTENLGSGMAKLGYADFLRDGIGSASFDVSWPAAPSLFNFATLQGSSSVTFRDGQILDVDPGAGGRAFSLISLQTIPRRLALDFNDIFSKGFRFDKMKGDFIFTAGNAYTSNFLIDGPVGRIDVSGRTGLVNKDYDQKIVFMPDLSSSLPVIGALIGGATGGFTVIIADRLARLFGKQVDNIGRLDYTIKGTWDNPVIERAKVLDEDKQEGNKGEHLKG